MQEQCRLGTLALQCCGQREMHRGPHGAQLPRYVLRVSEIKMSKESGVRKMPEARGVVCHGISRPWDIIGLVEVTVMALVECL